LRPLAGVRAAAPRLVSQAPTMHTSMTHGRGVITRSSPVSSGGRSPVRLQPTIVVGFPHRSRFWRARCSARLVLSCRTYPTRVLSTLPTSDAFVTMWLPRAGPIQLEAPSRALIEPLCCQSGSFASGGTSRTSPHRRALRLGPPPVKEKCSSRCSTNVFSRVDLARALRVHCPFEHVLSNKRSDPASLPPRRDLFGSGPRARSSLDLEVDRVPARSYRRSLLHDVTRAKIPAS
jgi:hypothetical protein